ncbi:MAG: hypothetical protein KGZ91_22575, partial [Afipia sp.]|nr:hypothetical protein [Afipia sp.]
LPFDHGGRGLIAGGLDPQHQLACQFGTCFLPALASIADPASFKGFITWNRQAGYRDSAQHRPARSILNGHSCDTSRSGQ